MRHRVRDERRADVGLHVFDADRRDRIGQSGDDARIGAVGDEVRGLLWIVREVVKLGSEHVVHAATDEFEILRAAVHGIGELINRNRCRADGDEWRATRDGGAVAGGKQRGPEIHAVQWLGVLRRHADSRAEGGEDIADPHVLIADHTGGQHARPFDACDFAHPAFIAVALRATQWIIERAFGFITTVVTKPDDERVVGNACAIERRQHTANLLIHAIHGCGDKATIGIRDAEVLIFRDQARRGRNGAVDRVEGQMQQHRLRRVAVLNVSDGLVREQGGRPAAVAA